MPWVAGPSSSHDSVLDDVARVLDPVLIPLGFAPGQLGASELEASVVFCRGDADSEDGACVDLVVDLHQDPRWRITDVRYWGFPAERWHLEFPAADDLATQLMALATTLPNDLG